MDIENIKIGEFFTLGEMIKNGDTVSYEEIINMTTLVAKVLDFIRKKFGVTIITSGYRSKEYNKKIGGAINSQHTKGEAADIILPNADLIEVFKFVEFTGLYDQLIYENKNGKQWIHVSYTLKRQNRMSALVIKDNETFVYYDGIFEDLGME